MVYSAVVDLALEPWHGFHILPPDFAFHTVWMTTAVRVWAGHPADTQPVSDFPKGWFLTLFVLRSQSNKQESKDNNDNENHQSYSPYTRFCIHPVILVVR
jgi:hypothetical protein